jgi:eukaryotic-like serine/threonine-protein kinase
LHASGDVTVARSIVERARERLLERALRIENEAWRERFLEQVPDNARILELAARWLGSAELSS